MKHTVKEVKLKNGAKGLLIHIPDASVMNFELNFRAGDYLAPRKKWETPHLMEHILLGANELYPRTRDFQAETERNGAYLNASTGAYEITYEAECADFEWDRILGLLLLAITKPLFLSEEFTAEFGNVHEELSARSNNHFRHLSLSLRQKYGFKAVTDQERLQLMENVQVSDVVEHYQATHSTDNLCFVIAGRLTKPRQQTIMGLLESLDLPKKGGRRPLPIETPSSLKKPLYIKNDTVDNMYFYLDTFMRRRMNERELDALSLANILLTETLHSRIFGTAREKGLVYGVSSNYGQTVDSSNWWVSAQVLPQNSRALMDIIVKELTTLRGGGLAPEDFEAAKQYALGRYQRSAQTVGGTAEGYSGWYFFDETIDDYYRVPQRIASVQRQEVVAIVNDLFAEKIWGLGVLGSCGQGFVDDLNNQVSSLWA